MDKITKESINIDNAEDVVHEENRIRISITKPFIAYVEQDKEYVRRYGKIEFTAVGKWIGSMINVAKILMNEGFAIVKEMVPPPKEEENVVPSGRFFLGGLLVISLEEVNTNSED